MADFLALPLLQRVSDQAQSSGVAARIYSKEFKFMKTFLIAVIGILAAAHWSPARAQDYTFETILQCGSLTAFPAAMNGSGAIVGSARDINSRFNSGMVYSDGTCKSYPVEDFSGITDSGGIFGTHNSATNYLAQPGSEPQALPNYPGAQGTEYCCMDILTGVMAGNYKPSETIPLSGFFYQNGNLISLPYNVSNGSNGPSYTIMISGLNGRGVTVGTYQGDGLYGFVYQNGKMAFHSYPSAKSTNFMAVNDNNVAVGTYWIYATGETGFVTYDIDTSTWTKLNFPAEYVSSQPVGISNTGVIVLQYSPSGGMVIATPASN
jgi:hypothetical protein